MNTIDAGADVTITLTGEERTELLGWLEELRNSKRVEEHRTETADFRKYVHRQVEIVEKLIARLH